MRSIDAISDWWGETSDPMQIVVLCGDQMDGRSISDVPIVQPRMPVDLEEDLVSWSREYCDPEYAVQFTEALEAMAALGIAPSIH